MEGVWECGKKGGKGTDALVQCARRGDPLWSPEGWHHRLTVHRLTVHRLTVHRLTVHRLAVSPSELVGERS